MKEYEFKVGDLVRVKPLYRLLNENPEVREQGFVDKMFATCGEIAVINSITGYSDNIALNFCDINDNDHWMYSNKWIERYSEEFKVGDRVVVRDYETMLNEFVAMNADIFVHYISTVFPFTYIKKHMCDKSATILKLETNHSPLGRYDKVWLNFDEDFADISSCVELTTELIEHDYSLLESSHTELINFINGN